MAAKTQNNNTEMQYDCKDKRECCKEFQNDHRPIQDYHNVAQSNHEDKQMITQSPQED